MYPNNKEIFSCYVKYNSDWLNIDYIFHNNDNNDVYSINKECVTPKFISNSKINVFLNNTNEQSTQASISKFNMTNNKLDVFKIECVNSILIKNNIIMDC